MQMDSKQFKELKAFLALSEKELKVYSALLALGNVATLGQVSLLSGLDIISTQQNLQTLISRGFAKSVPGVIINKYYALEPFLDSFIRLFDPNSFQGLLGIITKSLTTSKLSLIDEEKLFKDYLDSTLKKQKINIISKLETTEEQKNSLEISIDGAFDTIINTAFSIIQEMEKRGNKFLEKAANKFQNRAGTLLAAITEAQENLNHLFELSHVEPKIGEYATNIIEGEMAILLAIRDLIPRVEKYIIVFMPIPEIKSLLSLVDLSHHRSVNIDAIGNFNNVPKLILKKIKKDGISVKLHHDGNIDFWAVLKDDNEFLLAPIPDENKDLSAIYTTSTSIINFFSENLKKYTKFEPNI